jgi:hypothetical protein
MFQRFAFLALALTATPALALAEPPVAVNLPIRFKWQQDQTLTYKVIQRTTVRETAVDEKSGQPAATESTTNLTLTRKWHVKDVDADGAATLEMLITEMRNEIHKPDGDVTLDSANPADAKNMAAYLNVPIVVVRVDAQGRIVSVKEARGGSTNRLQAELPFRMLLPEAGCSPGQSWDRTFNFKLDPPLGAGESYEFAQKYTCTGIKDGLLIASVDTTLKNPPKTTSERMPLVPMLWTGEVYFNTAEGKYHAARLKARAELANHQGAGTKFEYESSYVEDAVK